MSGQDRRPYLTELHLHTVASPCAELEMLPPLIIERAVELGVELLAVTDHNCAENVQAVIDAAQGTGLWVLPGMEVQTREEAHLVTLFDTVEQALAWQRVVYEHLPPLANEPDLFGSQLVVDADGEFLRYNERLLLTSTDLSVEQVVAGVHDLGGLAIASHIDRQAFSLLGNLGFIPPGLPLDAVELSRHVEPMAWLARYGKGITWPVVRSSDAHRLSEMRPAMRLLLKAPTIAGIRRALQNSESDIELL